MWAAKRKITQKAWDPIDARYADLSNPEWIMMSRLPVHFWSDPTNHKRYIKWLGKKLGFKKPTDWYQVTYSDFISNRGGGLLD